MLNIRLYLATVAALALAGYGWGLWQNHTGWQEGRAALLAEQSDAAEKLRKENAQRQQVEDAKAAEAEQQGEEQRRRHGDQDRPRTLPASIRAPLPFHRTRRRVICGSHVSPIE